MNEVTPTFYIINYGHAGDMIYYRPFLKALTARYPDVEVIVECAGRHLYLLADLDVKLVTVEQDEIDLLTGNFVERVFEPGVFCFDLHSGGDLNVQYACGYSYNSLVQMYNDFLKKHDLYKQYRLYYKRETPFNTFPAQPHVPPAKAGAVFVENGLVFSGQSTFDLNEPLQEFAEMFPNLNFYCAARPNFEAGNVFDVSAYNLLELSELSNTCIAFLTRCSGVNAASTTEQNKYKPRCFAGIYALTADVWGWEAEENPVIYADDKEAVIEFLSYVNKNRAVLPIHVKDMETNPHKYRARLQDYVGAVHFSHLLRSKDEVNGCINYLNARSCLLDQHNDNKNWETAYILSDLSDGNYLDIGGRNITLLLNTMRKGVDGEKYVAYANGYPPLQRVPIARYVAGSICEGLAFTDGFFHNITFLSASAREIDVNRFAQEASRLLCGGGKLYVTFDYGEAKAPGRHVFDKADVSALIEACKANGLALTEPMNWQLGDAPDGANYTMGMLRFRRDCPVI